MEIFKTHADYPAAYAEGVNAFYNAVKVTDNPYQPEGIDLTTYNENFLKIVAWEDGWYDSAARIASREDGWYDSAANAS
jgi:hypothetical protein